MHSFLLFFAIKPCRDGGSKSETRCQDAFNNAHERAEHAIFRVQVGVCLSLELCLRPERGTYIQKNEGLQLDWLEKSREVQRRKIKENEHRIDLKHRKIKGSHKAGSCANNIHFSKLFCKSALRPRCGKKAFRGTSNPKGWIFVEHDYVPICKKRVSCCSGEYFFIIM